MWELDHKEGWAPRSWCFRPVVLGKILESPLDSSRSNQSILKEISPDYSLEGLMLKLKLQYFGRLMQRANSLEKTLMLGKIKGRRRRGERGWDDWMASPIQWTWVWASSGRWWRTGKPGELQSMGSQRVGHNLTNNNKFRFRRIKRIWLIFYYFGLCWVFVAARRLSPVAVGGRRLLSLVVASLLLEHML